MQRLFGVDQRLHAFDELLGAQVVPAFQLPPWAGAAETFGDKSAVFDDRIRPGVGECLQQPVGLQSNAKFRLVSWLTY